MSLRRGVAIGPPLVGVAVAAALLTAAMALPVLMAPTERIFGREIVGRHHDPFSVMRQFAGAPVPPPYLQPATDWVGRALAALVPPVSAYNLVVLLTFPLAAVFGWLLAFAVTRSTLASAVAGLAFAFSPFHLAQAAYHPHIAQVQWIPLFLLALWRCLHGITAGRAATLVVAIALVTLSNFYAGLMAAALVPALVPLFWLSPSPDGGVRSRRDLVLTTALLLAVATSALLAAGLLVPGLLDRTPSVERAELFRFGARWWAYLVPPVEHPLLGGVARSIWARVDIGDGLLEQQLYLGVGLLVPAAVAIVAWLRGRRAGGVAAAPALAAVAALALLCGLAPEHDVAGWRVSSPSALLYELAPMFRAYARFGVVVQLMVAVLAGIGAHQLWHSRRGSARGLVVVLLLLTAVEYAPWPWRWRDVLPTTAHRWLAARADGATRVFDCSTATAADRDTGWLAGVIVVYAADGQPQCDEPLLAARMRAQGVTHVLVRAGVHGAAPLPSSPADGLRLDFRGDDAVVLGVTAGAPAPFVEAFAGWYPRERAGDRAWRWSSGRSIVTLRNPAPTPRPVVLTLDLQAFGAPRVVTASIAGDAVATLDLGSGRAAFTVGPVMLAPGATNLVLESGAPALVPARVHPGSGDVRALAFALDGWMVAVAPPAP